MWFGLPVPHLPAYLGTYELELRPLARRTGEHAVRRRAQRRAADGYYAVGLARLWPAASVVALRMLRRSGKTCDGLRQRTVCSSAFDRGE